MTGRSLCLHPGVATICTVFSLRHALQKSDTEKENEEEEEEGKRKKLAFNEQQTCTENLICKHKIAVMRLMFVYRLGVVSRGHFVAFSSQLNITEETAARIAK